MTATSSSQRRKRVRLASMETFGFFDMPTTTTSDSPTPAMARTAGATETIERTPKTVQDLWNSTKLPSETLLDWEPQPTSTRLHKRNFRWTVVFLVAGLVAGVMAAGYWAYQRPAAAAEIALSAVTVSAAELSQALDGLAPHADDLATGTVDSSPSALTLPVNEAARSLFSASADLPGSESETRARAADAASLALDASRHLSNATAYLMALEPVLIAPPLETDPSLVDLTGAAQDFGNWRTHLNAVASALPEGVASDVTADLNDFIDSLEKVQGNYLDALRSQAQFAAVRVVDDIAADLEAVRIAMEAAIADSANSVADQISRAQDKLDQLALG